MSDKPAEMSSPQLHIVGIGASAGGLKAAEAFLQNCPADTGMAFVLVFHLSPRHKSMAAELLQRHTDMPVAQVAGQVRLAPDHVYVIPPDHGLSLVDHDLILTDRVHEDGRPTVIDHFFRALALHVGERAIGVVLSGTGSEGSQGLKAIKEAGGLTLVQAEDDAEYAGMPRSAVATGLVDFVLPVAQMPAKILEIRDFVVDFALPDGSAHAAENNADMLHKIFVQLRTRAGHDFSHYKLSTIRRRITRRMQVHRVGSLRAYLELLRDDDAEVQALFRELLISVTSFFRDPDAMQVLDEQAIRQLCADAGDAAGVRVWAAGCATGEEAYTLAMLLVEACDHLPRPPRLQVFASDVDTHALNVARRGVYPDAIAGDVSPERLQRFFDRSENGSDYTVKPFLRELVLFTEHNLLQDPPFSRLDLISCRNVLIYLKSAMQERLYALFHFALRPHGYLFLGSSESVGGESARFFTEVARKARLYQSRQVPAADMRLPLLAPASGRAGAPRTAALAARKRFEEIARDALLADYAPPCVIVNERNDVVYIGGRVGEFLEPGSGAANYNVLDMARNGLRLELRSALYRAFHQGKPTEAKPVRLGAGGDAAGRSIRLSVRLLPDAEGHALVVFEPAPERDAMQATSQFDVSDDMVRQLEGELAQTRESLQITIEELETSNEELRAANEELQSVNEELQSTGEELETGKEELQATNEELLAVNHELQARNDELARANADLENLIASIEIGTLFLDERLCVRRYTPQVTQLLNLIASDIGRPFAHVTHQLEDSTLAADAERVLQSQVPITRELASTDGRMIEVRLRPYRSDRDRLGGVVLTFIDVSERHRHELETQALNVELAAQRNYAENIIATVREPLLVLDEALRVVTANRAYCRDFAAAARDTEGRLLYELGAGQWDSSALHRLLQEVLRENTVVEAFEVRHDFGDGERIFLLNARVMETQVQARRGPLILLTFDEVTQSRRRAGAALAASERKYRNLFAAMDQAFCVFELVHDSAGQPKDLLVIDANPAVARHTGIAGEIVGRTVRQLLPDVEPKWLDACVELVASGKPQQYEGYVPGLQRWFAVHVFCHEDTLPNRFTALFHDVTEKKQAERRRQMLIHELNHRVRNNLAIVQALAAQTFQGAGCDAAHDTFQARLQALSRAHGMLTREEWKGARVSDIVHGGLAAWGDAGHERVQIAGPELRLNAAATLALAMALHELATNASKYGALSNDSGKVSVRWSVLDGKPRMLRLHWQERDGPPVVEPKHRGFGSWLIESGLAQDLGGSVRLTFAATGLSCTVQAPLANIEDSA